MTRSLFAAAVCVAALAVPGVSPARQAASCNVSTAWDGAVWELHVTGTIPNKVTPYLRVDGSQSWTSLHNQKGTVDDWTTRTAAELPAGSHLAEIIDAPNGVVGSSVVASCLFVT